ncbi:Serine/threonine protein kinase [Amycolatopsis tolypomycina]|uniref:Serine/threonine protein kinase n=1 Tax=Amycolatopsis tolypomycina TaxID=208445 RepID=A0A1H4VMA8_9PSEU|nr:serine/threonine-protein kinase [Amycolatopsis tolypomycina]SEC81454.1 Serine/threonine protein kinase [Amycolatopsis tolypomycina]
MKPLEPGDTRQAGKYRLVAALGEGGMGRVLLGVAPDGRLVALKQVHAEFARDAHFRSRFRQEVLASQRVSGAFTAAVMDADADAETPWLASVFVTGPSLKEAVEATGPLPAEAVRRLAVGLATALIEIHRVGLIHRDLKPGNVLLTADGPRVIDFGIARATEGGADLTGTGGIVGSPAFMSPEQAESRPLTPASDVFSLGGVLVMAATGRGPFTGSTTAQLLYNVVHASPDLTGLPPEIRTLVEPCLAKDPARRPAPQRILDFLGPVTPGTRPWPDPVHRLIDAQDTAVRTALSWPAPAPLPIPPPAPPRRRRWFPVVTALATVAGLAVGSLVAVLVARADADPPTAGANLDPTSLETLRRTDPCKVLNGVSVPDAGKLSAVPDSGYFDRCEYRTKSGQKISIKLGDQIYVEAGRPAEDLDGRPVLFTEISGSTCDASVQVPAQPELGVTALAETCGLAKTTLAKVLDRIRGGTGYDLPPGTLLATDPCSVLDKTAVTPVLGPVREVKLNRLRDCEWTATTSLRLTFDKGYSSVPDDGSPVDLGGVTGTRNPTGDSCAVSWHHRQFDAKRTEHIRIFALKTGGGACDVAAAFGKALAGKLPRP